MNDYAYYAHAHELSKAYIHTDIHTNILFLMQRLFSCPTL